MAFWRGSLIDRIDFMLLKVCWAGTSYHIVFRNSLKYLTKVGWHHTCCNSVISWFSSDDHCSEKSEKEITKYILLYSPQVFLDLEASNNHLEIARLMTDRETCLLQSQLSVVKLDFTQGSALDTRKILLINAVPEERLISPDISLLHLRIEARSAALRVVSWSSSPSWGP